MSLEQQIMAEMKEAMKSKNESALRSLRAIKAEIIKAKTEPGASGEINEETEQNFLQKMNVKNGRLSGSGIRTRDLSVMCLLPYPLDH